MNTIEHMIEESLISILKEEVPEILWLHFENEATSKENKPVGIIRAERGERTTLCYNNFEVSMFVVGARDEYHRKIDNAVGDREALALDIEASAGGAVSIGTILGWTVPRGTSEQNLYSRTWQNQVEAGYAQTTTY